MVIMIDVVTRQHTGAAASAARLHLVDLAGSERVDKSEVRAWRKERERKEEQKAVSSHTRPQVTGRALKEAQYINRSLSALGDVMEALDKKNPHIPYRNRCVPRGARR